MTIRGGVLSMPPSENYIGPIDPHASKIPASGAEFLVCPKWADYQWGKDPHEQLMVRFDS